MSKIIAIAVLAAITGPLSNCSSLTGPPDPPVAIAAPVSAE